jgi:hypothetical protein
LGNNGSIPDRSQIYDWESLRRVVNHYGKKGKGLPPTEQETGFTFVRYTIDSGRSDYSLLVELHEPQDGVNRVEVTPYGVDRVN